MIYVFIVYRKSHLGSTELELLNVEHEEDQKELISTKSECEKEIMTAGWKGGNGSQEKTSVKLEFSQAKHKTRDGNQYISLYIQCKVKPSSTNCGYRYEKFHWSL